jgi:hypothetical protein
MDGEGDELRGLRQGSYSTRGREEGCREDGKGKARS